MRVSRPLAALALAAALIAPAWVAAAPPVEPKTVAELVPLVQATYKSVQAIRAEFVQTSKNPMTGVEEKQAGKILLERPRKYRLELGFPLTSAVVGDGTTQWVYAVQAKQVTVQKELGTGGGPVQLIDDLGRLTDIFDATLVTAAVPPKPIYQLTLKPKVAGALVQMDITLKKQSYILQELDLTYTGGVAVKMAFTGMVLGGDIPDAQFAFKAPPGVTVVQM